MNRFTHIILDKIGLWLSANLRRAASRRDGLNIWRTALRAVCIAYIQNARDKIQNIIRIRCARQKKIDVFVEYIGYIRVSLLLNIKNIEEFHREINSFLFPVNLFNAT